jgi:chemotaxis protein CheD
MRFTNKEIIYVFTGEVKAGTKEVILKSNAIGSCIAVVAYDIVNKVGAIAHIMLPGKAPFGKTSDKYAIDAIQNMLKKMESLGVKKENIEFCLAGGANVLQKKDDKIGEENIFSVLNFLEINNYKIRAKSLGGVKRRSVTLNIETGKVLYSVGDDVEELFWEFLKE